MKTLKDSLLPSGQEHLLRFWDELEESQKAELREEIENIDFGLVARLHRDLVLNPAPVSSGGALAPLRGQSLNALPAGKQESLRQAGMRALSEGKAAAFLVAGG